MMVTKNGITKGVQPKGGNKPTGRDGKKSINAFINPAAAKQLKLLALEVGKTQQDLLVEAINDLLVKHGRKPLA